MPFSLDKVPFSRNQSFIGVSCRNLTNAVYIHCARRPFGEDKVFEAIFLLNGKPVKPAVDFQPTRLRFYADGAEATIYISGQDDFVLSADGFEVRLHLLEVPSKNGDVPEAYPLAYGTQAGPNYVKMISVNARFCIGARIFEGEWDLDGPLRLNERRVLINHKTQLVIRPSAATGKLIVKVNIASHELHASRYTVPDPINDIAQISAEWAAFAHALPSVPQVYGDASLVSWYTLWASTVPAGGNYRYPAILMSMEFMASVWTWDHCFNALAMSLHDRETALNQFFLPFELQAPNGALPDYINPDLEVVWGVTKPPVHGWCFGKLMDRFDLTIAELQKAYDHLVNWTRWWLDYNDVDGDGIPDYPMGCDSGWDNSTVFDPGYFVESPDLCAFLVLQMRTLARIADELGDGPSQSYWVEEAKALYERLVQQSWTEHGFVATVSHSNDHDVQPTSLITLVPLVLGELLDEPVKAKLLAKLKAEYLTQFGLATENTSSPFYKADNYWRGPIWAPSTYLIIDGLVRAGEKALALEIAERYCRMLAFHARGDFENFDALKGEGLRASGYTWTSSVNILLLSLLQEQAGPLVESVATAEVYL